MALRENAPGIAACVGVGLILAGLIVGFEPVGGDPDRIFRPIKAELSEALHQGRLPFWSERMGLGIPLIAESHVAAFYPPNWLLYRFLGVNAAYRISMWLHCVAIAASTFAYSRRLGNTPSGSGLAAIAFSFCGFLTIQSSHEWAYQTLPYLPLCLLASDHYAESGRVRWLAALAVLWGVQITIGHFQVQMWTGGLSLLTGSWRILADRRPIGRLAGLVAGLAWGGLIAAAQLAPTWELARLVGQFRRSIDDLSFYSYPPGHWAELVVPALFRRLEGGGEAPYWFTQQTTEFESFLFVGTIPALLACVGLIAGGRGTAPWRWIVPISFALATMPRWWPAGYAMVLQVPGLGLFRCPARYSAVTSFGLAILAGRGLDRSISPTRFRIGLAISALFAIAAIGWAIGWVLRHPMLLDALGGDLGVLSRVGLAVPGLGLGFWAIGSRRRGTLDRAWTILALTAVELAGVYHLGGSTRWGWSISLPSSSPVLSGLAGDPGVGLVGGGLDNLPIRAGLATATPYIGFPLPPPNALLKAAQDARFVDTPDARRWLRRYGVTHVVGEEQGTGAAGSIADRVADPALDVLAYRPRGRPERRSWRVIRLSGVFPEARVATRSVVLGDRSAVLRRLAGSEALDEVIYLKGDEPPAAGSARAASARVVRWGRGSGEVEHDGPCDLVLNHAHYPGWLARVDGGPERPVARAGDGLIAVRLDGSGISRVSIRYRPNGFVPSAATSAIASATALGVLFRRRSRPDPIAPTSEAR